MPRITDAPLSALTAKRNTSVVTSSRDSDTDRHRKSFTYFITRFRAPRREGGRLCVYIVLTQFQLPFVVAPSFSAARPVPFLRTLSLGLACSCGRGPWASPSCASTTVHTNQIPSPVAPRTPCALAGRYCVLCTE
jgi:hypothetical protein